MLGLSPGTGSRARSQSHGTTRTPAAGAWMLMPAARGAGHWLVCLHHPVYGCPVVIAAPGVAIDPGSDREDLCRWRLGRWEHLGAFDAIDEIAPSEIDAQPLRVVVALVPDYAKWAREVQRTLIARVRAYGGRTVDGAPRAQRADESRRRLAVLVTDAQDAFPGGPLVSPAKMQPGRLRRLLSWHRHDDFDRLLADAAERTAPLPHRHSRPAR